MEWADHFSATAADYSRYRPLYPPALFEYLVSIAPSRDVAWDCGAGNCQAALALAPYFDTVVATDASWPQLVASPHRANVLRAVSRAEHCPLPTNSVSLITIAQALHWFAGSAFYSEAKRVATRGAVIAAWSYMLARFEPPVDAVLERFYTDVIGAYWPPEREHVVKKYQSLPFPFAEITPPSHEMSALWTLDHLLGYIGTWSAVKRARAAIGSDPLLELATQLEAVWGAPHVAKPVTWPLGMRVGRITE